MVHVLYIHSVGIFKRTPRTIITKKCPEPPLPIPFRLPQNYPAAVMLGLQEGVATAATTPTIPDNEDKHSNARNYKLMLSESKKKIQMYQNNININGAYFPLSKTGHIE